MENDWIRTMVVALAQLELQGVTGIGAPKDEVLHPEAEAREQRPEN